MIDSMDIYRGIKKTLENNFNKIKVQTKDVKNPRPPCFYIKPMADNNYQTASNFETTDYLYSIIYFSGKETLEDLLTVKEQLKKVFIKPIKVTSYDDPEDENYIEVDSINITINEDEYFLNASLTIQMIQPLAVERFDSTNDEIMEEMELEIDSEM